MFPVLAGSNPSGYNLTRSLRFRASASAYLNRTPASAGNRQIWTWSGWVKRGALGIDGELFDSSSGGGAVRCFLRFSTSNVLYFQFDAATASITTTQVFRDPSSWYHIMLAADSTQATASNRLKLYVNGAQITAGTFNYPSLNANSELNIASQPFTIGRFTGGGENFDGYLTEVNFIDGQALTPSSFGSTNSTTGVWQPARYAGTYGTNGFYLPFTDNSALTTSSNVGLGKDFSGNGNYWTTNNISITAGVTYDSMTDVPTLTSATAANFAVVNPLQYGSYVTLSNGNLTVTGNTSTNSAAALATIGNLTSGKWYWEYTQGTVQSETCGICTQNMAGVSLINAENIAAYGIGVRANGNVYGGTVANITSWTTGDVIGIAVDCDNGAVYWSKNGTWLNSGVPTSGASKTGAVGVWTPSSTKIITPTFGAYNGGFVSPTFGQRPFSYTPPTGFVALNTYNLPTSTIVKGNTVMDATLYTGNGSTQTITNAGAFKPDFVWIKNRTGGNNHALFDSVRGATLRLYSDSTIAEQTEATTLTAFNSNGFSVSSSGAVNASANNYVGWQWQAGQGSTSSNTSGTITSTVSVNASAGFSIVTYTGNGTNGATVGHGLGVKPSLIIEKGRASAYNWVVQGCGVLWPTATQTLFLNSTSGLNAGSGIAAPTSSVFTPAALNYANESGLGYVAYCWTPIAGYSAMGSYSGNGSTDGPFVYTGFRPRWVLIKSSTQVTQWILHDTARDTYNTTSATLFPNLPNAEAANNSFDILSNGFKIRTGAGDSTNDSGQTYIYAAFAENPFKNALAR